MFELNGPAFTETQVKDLASALKTKNLNWFHFPGGLYTFSGGVKEVIVTLWVSTDQSNPSVIKIGLHDVVDKFCSYGHLCVMSTADCYGPLFDLWLSARQSADLYAATFVKGVIEELVIPAPQYTREDLVPKIYTPSESEISGLFHAIAGFWKEENQVIGERTLSIDPLGNVSVKKVESIKKSWLSTETIVTWIPTFKLELIWRQADDSVVEIGFKSVKDGRHRRICRLDLNRYNGIIISMTGYVKHDQTSVKMDRITVP